MIYHPEKSVILTEDIGEGTKIHALVWIGKDVHIGDNCMIQAMCFIPDWVSIGNDVFIGPSVVFTNDKHPPSYGKHWARTEVGDGAVIGANATILPGIRIGKNAVVGAGSVVTKSVPDGATVIGNPAREQYKGVKGAPFDM